METILKSLTFACNELANHVNELVNQLKIRDDIINDLKKLNTEKTHIGPKKLFQSCTDCGCSHDCVDISLRKLFGTKIDYNDIASEIDNIINQKVGLASIKESIVNSLKKVDLYVVSDEERLQKLMSYELFPVAYPYPFDVITKYDDIIEVNLNGKKVKIVVISDIRPFKTFLIKEDFMNLTNKQKNELQDLIIYLNDW